MYKICYVTTVPSTIRAFILRSAEYLYQTGEFDISFISNPNAEIEAEFPDHFHFYPVKMKRGIGTDGLRAIAEMVKIFKREKFDLVQYSTPNASCYASIAARLVGIPVRLYCQWGMVYVGYDGIKRKIFKAIEKMVCRNSTWIEPDSYGNLKFSHEEGLYSKDKSSVVWNGSAAGVSLEKFDIDRKNEFRHLIRQKHNISEEAFVFGYVGRLNGDKGINELFTAARKILSGSQNTYLLIVGTPTVKKDVDKELCDWAKTSDRVIFAGHSKNPEQYMAAMDCYVLASYREGFGMTVIEAGSMALPVIVTNIPGPTEGMIKDKTGFVVEKKDSQGLYLAMVEMMDSSETRDEFAKNGREHVISKFDQNVLLKKIYEDRKKLLMKS